MLWIDPDYADAFPSGDLFGWARRQEGKVYRQGKGRTTLRFERAGRAFFLKRHSGIGWREIFKELLQGRLPALGAANEWLALRRLGDLHVLSLRPVAYGRRGWNPARQESFLVTEELQGTLSLEDLALAWQARDDFVALKRKLIVQVAALAAALHGSGMNHRDLYICHLHIRRDWLAKPVGAPEIFVIDLHRAQMRRRVPRRWQVKDLAGLDFSSMDAGLTERDRLRFVKAYAGQPLAACLRPRQRFWRAVRRRAQRLYARLAPAASASGS